MLKPYGDLSEDEAYAAFKEQAAILVEGGVDGFIIEWLYHRNDVRPTGSSLRFAGLQRGF